MKAAISDLAPIVNRIDGCSNAFRVYMFTDFQRALFTGIDFGDSDIWKIIGYINDKISSVYFFNGIRLPLLLCQSRRNSSFRFGSALTWAR